MLTVMVNSGNSIACQFGNGWLKAKPVRVG